MVTGGEKDGTSVQLLSINGTRLCALPNLPGNSLYYHSQSGPLVCGGNSMSQICVTFSSGTWQQTHYLGQRREAHTAWASPRGVLLMGSTYSQGMKTTELLNDDGSTTASFNLDNNRL